jgi:hypothetical protein
VANDVTNKLGEDGGLIEFVGLVELHDPTFVTANALPKTKDADLGGILFHSRLDSEANEFHPIELTAKSGDITFMGTVGTPASPGTRIELGRITIKSARDVTAMSTIDAQGLLQETGSGTTRFTNDVTIVEIKAPNVLPGEIDLTTETVQLDQSLLAAKIPPETLWIATSGGSAKFNANTKIIGTVDIKTNGGNMTFMKTLDGVETGTDTLSLAAGTGEVVFEGLVGSKSPLEFITIASAANATANAAFTAGTVDLREIPGLMVFIDNATIETVTMLAKSAVSSKLNNIGFRGSDNTISNRVEFSNYGVVTLGNGPADMIHFENGVSTLGATAISTTPQLTKLFATIKATNDSIVFGKSELTGDSLVQTADQSIQFADTLESTNKQNHSLTLNAGKGPIEFIGAIGGAAASDTALGDLSIEMAGDVTAKSTIRTGRLLQLGGSGTTNLQDDVLAMSDGDENNPTIAINTNKILLHGATDQPADQLQIMAPDGNVILNGSGEFNFQPGQENRPVDLENVLITASGGKLSSQSLLPSAKFDDGSFGALDKTFVLNLPPIQGREGTGKIEVNVADSFGSDFVIRIDWGEGKIPDTKSGFAPAPDLDAWFVEALLPAGNQDTFEHHFTTTPERAKIGEDIDVWVTISEFAQDTIQIKTGPDSILQPVPDGMRVNPDGTPNGIQTVVLIDVTNPPAASSLPQPPPLGTPAVPPALVPNVATPAPPQIVTTLAPQSSGATTSDVEQRYYELRIVTVNAQGQEQEPDELRTPLTNEALGVGADEANPGSILPFHLGRLRDLFRRLPDDHYRIYLMEDGAERLILDFTIQQGRPVEVQEDTPTIDQNNAERPADPQLPPDDEVPAASIEEVGPVAVLPIPGHEVYVSMAHGANLVPEHEIQTWSFAQRLGRTEFIAHGGILVTAAGLLPAARSRRETAADRLMAKFGRQPRNQYAFRRTVGRNSTPANSHSKPPIVLP